MSTLIGRVSVLMEATEWAALEALVLALPADAQILEFGAGGSTVALAAMLQPTQRLYSVESDGPWYDRVREGLGDRWPNVSLLFRPRRLRPEFDVTPRLPSTTVGFSPWLIEECTAGLSDYLDLDYGQDWAKTGLVLVDGVGRGACLALLRPVLAPGTLVVLHDWCGREDRTEWYRFGVILYIHESLTDSLLVLRA